jgi:hypothetical protein
MLYDREQGDIPSSGSVSFYLRMFSARHHTTTPKNFNLMVSAVSQSWDEGLGLDMEDYSDYDAANWINASDTKIQASASILVRDATVNANTNTIQLTGANASYLFTSIDDSTPAPDYFHIGASAAACATNIALIINESASSDFHATTITDMVYLSASTAGYEANSNTLTSSAVAAFAVTGSENAQETGLSGNLAGGNNATPWGWPGSSQGGAWYLDTSSSFTASFTNGFENMELDITPLVEQWLSSSDNSITAVDMGQKTNYGLMIKLHPDTEAGSDSYYTKKFFARGSQFFYRRPIIEARWDSSKKDNRANFYYSSSLAPAADNLNTIYFYNYVRGQLKDIPGLGATKQLFVSIYSGSANNRVSDSNRLNLSLGGDVAAAADLTMTGGVVATGIYSASFAFTGTETLTKIFDVWHTGTQGASSYDEYFTGTIYPAGVSSSYNSWAGSMVNPSQQYVSNITNLKPYYSRGNTVARFRLYTRKKDWGPTIYTVSSNNMPISLIEDAYYKIFRVDDGTLAVNYGTGSDYYTRLSYDLSGSYFDVDMSLLEGDSTYAIKFIYYLNSQYIEQSEEFRFKVK